MNTNSHFNLIRHSRTSSWGPAWNWLRCNAGFISCSEASLKSSVLSYCTNHHHGNRSNPKNATKWIKPTTQKQKATSDKFLCNYRSKSFIWRSLFLVVSGRSTVIHGYVKKGVIYPRIFFSVASIHFNPVRHHSQSASSTLCKRKVIAYLLLNDSVMVYYIINHLSVVSKHTQCDSNPGVIYV